MKPENLILENDYYRNTAAVSRNNRGFGFSPAFMDGDTGKVYLSCFSNGRPAPIHLLDGLPDHLVARRATDGRVVKATERVVSGFTRNGEFHSREQMTRLLPAASPSMS